MRRLAAVLLVFALSGCGGGDGVPKSRATATASADATPPAEPATGETLSLSCGTTKVRLPAMPANLTRAGSFARLHSLTRPLDVKGMIWRENDEQLYVGVVCGVRTAEQFVTLVARSTLTAYKGRPALRWNTRSGLRNFMWLERPGTAVYIGATPGLSPQIRRIAAGVS
ncbi:hypothetical protein [Nonomuraea basaltis]|uniref:hypothetical protein n=1 Tax=Nonomuraea basaltis TaxID=2495887 RepID=UPI00110C4053|nr:hypothetical protein [Nonomuraea basaltis]TMR89458.1 hypothetical protein EJK15_60720 [Nonomuraea basaltis]